MCLSPLTCGQGGMKTVPRSERDALELRRTQGGSVARSAIATDCVEGRAVTEVENRAKPVFVTMRRNGWSSRPQAFNAPFTFDLWTWQVESGATVRVRFVRTRGEAPVVLPSRGAEMELSTLQRKAGTRLGLTPPNAPVKLRSA